MDAPTARQSLGEKSEKKRQKKEKKRQKKAREGKVIVCAVRKRDFEKKKKGKPQNTHPNTHARARTRKKRGRFRRSARTRLPRTLCCSTARALAGGPALATARRSRRASGAASLPLGAGRAASATPPAPPDNTPRPHSQIQGEKKRRRPAQEISPRNCTGYCLPVQMRDENFLSRGSNEVRGGGGGKAPAERKIN